MVWTGVMTKTIFSKADRLAIVGDQRDTPAARSSLPRRLVNTWAQVDGTG